MLRPVITLVNSMNEDVQGLTYDLSNNALVLGRWSTWGIEPYSRPDGNDQLGGSNPIADRRGVPTVARWDATARRSATDRAHRTTHY